MLDFVKQNRERLEVGLLVKDLIHEGPPRVSEIVIDASLALQWFLEDAVDRGHSLAVLERLSEDRALVPLLWSYEVGNGFTMACRRKRISYEPATGYLARVRQLPITADSCFLMAEDPLRKSHISITGPSGSYGASISIVFFSHHVLFTRLTRRGIRENIKGNCYGALMASARTDPQRAEKRQSFGFEIR